VNEPVASVDTIRWEGGRPGFVRLIDQTLLPRDVVVLEVRTVEEMRDAIKRLAVRGAPAIGVAAAFGVVLGIQSLAGESAEKVARAAEDVCARLATARPTAVNLFWALDRMKGRCDADRNAGRNGAALVAGLFDEATAIYEEDRAICQRLGDIGAELIRDGFTVLTHCNAGALATAGIGTALAPIYRAREQGKRVAVYADETRPLLQGARLTAWELDRAGIEVTLITDSMAADVMRKGRIDAVFVGADRIARNGDVANKIGTYSVAVLASQHELPFYVVAPLSTFDAKCENGDAIPIEERGADEITHGFGKPTAPAGVRVYNPAFDVTPARLITGIVTEAGLIERPDRARVDAILKSAGRL
jgi:methylthioribose-1-phosphate isomerase